MLPNNVDIWKHQNKHAHSPTGPRPYFDISTPHVPTQPWHNDNHRNKRRWHTSIFKQKPTQISCVKQSKINVTHLSRRNNATSASDSSPSCSLSSLHRWKAASIFTRSYLLPDRNPSFPSEFSSFLSSYNIYLSIYLSIIDLLISVLCTQIECSLLSIITRHTPYCWLAASVFLETVRHCGQKRFSKIA